MGHVAGGCLVVGDGELDHCRPGTCDGYGPDGDVNFLEIPTRSCSKLDCFDHKDSKMHVQGGRERVALC